MVTDKDKRLAHATFIRALTEGRYTFNSDGEGFSAGVNIIATVLAAVRKERDAEWSAKVGETLEKWHNTFAEPDDLGYSVYAADDIDAIFNALNALIEEVKP